jgi:O-antigen/teichoic acid export membrane protein
MTPFARIARLSAAFLGSNMARAAIGFGLSFALARGLGAEGFGRWIICTAWASTLTVVVDLGLGVLLTRDGARGDSEPGALLSGALVLRLTLVIPLAALLYAGAGYLSADAETVAGLRVAALLGTAGAAYGCFGALFRSQPRWLPTVLGIETGWLAIQLAAAWWIVHVESGRSGRSGRSGGPVGPGGYGTVASLLTLALLVQLLQIAMAAGCWRTVFGGGGRLRLPRADAIVALIRRALPFAASGIVANVQTRIGPLMLGYLSTQTEVGLFAAASRFGSVARLAPQAVFAGALPVLSHEHGRDRAAAAGVFHAFDRVLLLGSAGLSISCLLFAAPVLRLVYGASFTSAAPALVWVSVGLIPLLSNSGRKVFLYASGGEGQVVRWSAVALAIQLCAGAALIPAYGSIGAAVSVAIGEALVWWPLRRQRTGDRTVAPSSPRRAQGSTFARPLPLVFAAQDPEADR